MLNTKRLQFRKLTYNDKEKLENILCDVETMIYYPHPFSKDDVSNWIKWNISNYNKYNHGLWALILKKSKLFIGECGITIQEIEGEYLPEIGYHINKNYWNNGYATEAAKACINYAWDKLNLNEIYIYTKVDNVPARRVAEKIGMKKIKEFKKIVFGESVVEVLYSINKQNGT